MLYEVITTLIFNLIYTVIFVFFSVLTWLTLRKLSYVDIAADDDGIWYMHIGKANGLILWNKIATIKERLYLQCVITSYSIHYTKLYDGYGKHFRCGLQNRAVRFHRRGPYSGTYGSVRLEEIPRARSVFLNDQAQPEHLHECVYRIGLDHVSVCEPEPQGFLQSHGRVSGCLV